MSSITYKKIGIIVGTAIIHYGLSLLVLLIGLGMTGEAMDRGIVSPYQNLVLIIIQIFMFPLITLANIINVHLPSGYGSILWFLNSLCWGVSVYFIVKWYRKYKTEKKEKL